MKRKGKRFLSMTVVGALMSMMAASAAHAAEISMWGDYTGPDGELMTQMVENFNAKDNGIGLDFSIVPETQMQEKLPISISTGTAPTMAIMMNTSMAAFLEADQLLPVDDFFEKTGMAEEDFVSGVLEPFMVDGALYGLPQDLCVSRAMYWNKDLFEKAGLDPETPPATWEEVFEFAAKIEDKDNGIYGVSLPATDIGSVTCYLRSCGGELFDFETGEATIHRPENVEALSALQEALFAPELTPKQVQDTQAGILAGQYGIFFSGPWLVTGLEENGIHYGVVEMPAGSATVGKTIEGGLYLFFTGSSEEERKAAYDYIAYTYSDENRIAWSTGTGFPPCTVGALESDEVAANEVLTVFSDMEDGNLLYPFLSYSGELENSVLKPMMERIESGEDVATVLEEAQAQASQIAAENK